MVGVPIAKAGGRPLFFALSVTSSFFRSAFCSTVTLFGLAVVNESLRSLNCKTINRKSEMAGKMDSKRQFVSK
jgi:hypothetical protein